MCRKHRSCENFADFVAAIRLLTGGLGNSRSGRGVDGRRSAMRAARNAAAAWGRAGAIE
ncbi:Uncharacterised protein [Pandoraea pulmonicola]|uniref:Uncharacterized protein n=1 Tax=Pandoraea pulmonicola TaxID=93221 RepID=A0AAJ4ZGI7_PANPU|nr:Uncharacterised protein [Pandoraea pulmonicola]